MSFHTLMPVQVISTPLPMAVSFSSPISLEVQMGALIPWGKMLWNRTGWNIFIPVGSQSCLPPLPPAQPLSKGRMRSFVTTAWKAIQKSPGELSTIHSSQPYTHSIYKGPRRRVSITERVPREALECSFGSWFVQDEQCPVMLTVERKTKPSGGLEEQGIEV